jgi:glycosyltransferase involved in cell wall biosynthesis
MRREIVSRGVPPERVAIAPNMVDTARFTPGPRDAGLAARLGIAGDETVVGYISSFNAYEETDRIVHTVATLRRAGLKVRGLLVGDGFRRASDERLAERLAPGAVLFPGRVTHDLIPDYYRLIDVFVIPRSDDRISRLVTPLKPYEALAAGRAIVASRVGALAEILEEGVTAIFYEAGDTAGLTDAVRRLVTDDEARARLGTEARQQAVARHGLEGTGRRYRELYERLGVA